MTSGAKGRLSLVGLKFLADGNDYVRKDYGRVLTNGIQISFELLMATISLFEFSHFFF